MPLGECTVLPLSNLTFELGAPCFPSTYLLVMRREHQPPFSTVNHSLLCSPCLSIQMHSCMLDLHLVNTAVDRTLHCRKMHMHTHILVTNTNHVLSSVFALIFKPTQTTRTHTYIHNAYACSTFSSDGITVVMDESRSKDRQTHTQTHSC